MDPGVSAARAAFGSATRLRLPPSGEKLGMPSDTYLSTIEPRPVRTEAPPRGKFRTRFRKAGDLRLVSHHDLMHVCERMFRRADLSVPLTQGFNPRPRMWFASALALGISGLNEVLEFELSPPLSAEEVRRRLAMQVPPGMEILSVRAIDVRSAAQVRRAFYRLPLGERACELGQKCEAFLRRSEYWVERRRPHPRQINIRPFVHELRVEDDFLEMAVWVTSNGAVRPEEVVAALDLPELFESGAVIERTDLELFDELPASVEAPPFMQSVSKEMGANDDPSSESARNAARPHAMISHPMSFDS